MDRTETIRLLGVVSLADDRAVRTDETEQAVQVELWATALRDVPYDFAVQAIGEHYAESAWPIMPKDIAARWRTTVRDRISRHVELHVNDDLPDIGWRQTLAARRRAVIHGEQQPALPPASAPTPAPRSEPTAEFRAALAELRRRNRERPAAVQESGAVR
ncbi:hypothetical protein [Streptomyces pini]|uniref:Replicative helicase inhibitor G39P N-terminal domain-containing protein n=1 Tax=Streptomyces pini TaxID=1520580 RepID=A0A1I4C2Y2_9ACTN|nr:hypothetical protein [Streptomyces pini]SFK74556.1 hypothetical protein SAMN05192584_108209 [Streptomyces pini]